MTPPAVGCALLAAGGSRRLGRPKQLLPFQGMPLVRYITEQALRSRAELTAVVLGAERAPIEAALSGVGATLLFNPAWAEGLAASIRVAAAWAMRFELQALVLAGIDQPRLDHVVFDALITVAEDTSAPRFAADTRAAARYLGVVGAPVLFGSAHFPALLALRGDRGARHLLEPAPSAVRIIEFPGGANDIDTPQDLALLDA